MTGTRKVQLFALAVACVGSGLFVRWQIGQSYDQRVFLVPMSVAVVGMVALFNGGSVRRGLIAGALGLWIGANIARIAAVGHDVPGLTGMAFAVYPVVASVVGLVALGRIAGIIHASTGHPGFWVDSLRSEAATSFRGHPAGRFVAVESGVIAHLFVPQRLGWTASPGRNEVAFTMWEATGQRVTIRALAIVIAFETIIVHLALHVWVGSFVAGAATALSVYSLLWLVGDGRAVRGHPLVVDDATIDVRVGLRVAVTIPLSSVLEISHTRQKPTEDFVPLVVFGQGNTLIRLSEPVVVERLFSKESTRLVQLHVDDPQGFIAEVKRRQGQAPNLGVVGRD